MKDYRNYPTKVRPLNSIVPQFFAIVVLSLLLTIQPSSSHSDIKSDMSNFKNIETIKENTKQLKNIIRAVNVATDIEDFLQIKNSLNIVVTNLENVKGLDNSLQHHRIFIEGIKELKDNMQTFNKKLNKKDLIGAKKTLIDSLSIRNKYHKLLNFQKK